MNTFSQSTMKVLRYSSRTIILSISLMFAVTSLSFAQDDEVESRVRRLSETETSRLRAVLAVPTPQGALSSTHREQFYDQAITAEADIGERSLYQSNRAYMLYQRRDWTRLRNEAPLLQQQLQQTLRTLTYPLQRFTVLRAHSRVAQALSLQHENFGQYQQSIAQAEEAAKFSRLAADVVKNDTSTMRRQFALATQGESMRRVVSANRVAGRLAEAEVALAQLYARNPTEPKSNSLRQAMLQVMEMPQYAHPAFWAPDVLVGDGGR
jgi:hypothetical protein